jgi:hypothetical protein
MARRPTRKSDTVLLFAVDPILASPSSFPLPPLVVLVVVPLTASPSFFCFLDDDDDDDDRPPPSRISMPPSPQSSGIADVVLADGMKTRRSMPRIGAVVKYHTYRK